MRRQKTSAKKDGLRISGVGLAIMLLSIAIIVAAFTSIIYFQYKLVEVQVLEVDMKINDIGTGFVLDNDIIHLGNLKKGGATTTRDVVLFNNFDFPVEIKYTITGNISDMVAVSPNNIIIEPYQNKTISFTGIPKKDIGYYHGYVELKFLRN